MMLKYLYYILGVINTSGVSGKSEKKSTKWAEMLDSEAKIPGIIKI